MTLLNPGLKFVLTNYETCSTLSISENSESSAMTRIQRFFKVSYNQTKISQGVIFMKKFIPIFVASMVMMGAVNAADYGQPGSSTYQQGQTTPKYSYNDTGSSSNDPNSPGASDTQGGRSNWANPAAPQNGSQTNPYANYNNRNQKRYVTDANGQQNGADTRGVADSDDNGGDIKVSQDVRQALMKDSSLSANAQNISVITNEGVVTLKGNVNSAKDKANVESVVKKVAGVKSVDNQLNVNANAKPF